ncbi:hypothetical protein [Oscillatoria sp. FACHB-1407]|nr:hypothetical protein [Oscillatoria sp. FACHB-1407]
MASPDLKHSLEQPQAAVEELLIQMVVTQIDVLTFPLRFTPQGCNV